MDSPKSDEGKEVHEGQLGEISNGSDTQANFFEYCTEKGNGKPLENTDNLK